MATTVKTTMHGSDPKVTPVVKDVYKDDVLKASNTIQEDSPVTKAATDYLSKVSTSPSSISSAITKSIASSDDGLTVDFSSVKKRLENSYGISGTTTGLSNTMKNDISKALGTASGNDAKVLFDGGVKTFNSVSDVTSASSVMKMVNSISGQDKVFELLDLGAQASVVRGLAATLIKWGIPDILDALIDSIKDAATKNALLEENAIAASRIGDLSQTKHYANKMGQRRANAITDTLITNLQKYFKMDDEDTRSYAVVGNELLAFYIWLDPKWDYDKYDTSLKTLTYHTYANDLVVEVFAYTDVGLDAVLGSQVTLELPFTTAGKLFPKMLAWQHG